MNNPGQVQRSHLPPAPSKGGGVSLPFGEGWGGVLHSRGARVFRYAPVLRRAKGRGAFRTPRFARGYSRIAPSGLESVHCSLFILSRHTERSEAESRNLLRYPTVQSKRPALGSRFLHSARSFFARSGRNDGVVVS